MRTATVIFLRHAVTVTQTQLRDCSMRNEPLVIDGDGVKTLAMILDLALEYLDDLLKQ